VYRLGDGQAACWFGPATPTATPQPEPRLGCLCGNCCSLPSVGSAAQQPITAEAAGPAQAAGGRTGGKAAQFGPIRGGLRPTPDSRNREASPRSWSTAEGSPGRVKQQAARPRSAPAGSEGTRAMPTVEHSCSARPEQLRRSPRSSIGAGNRLSWSSRLSAIPQPSPGPVAPPPAGPPGVNARSAPARDVALGALQAASGCGRKIEALERERIARQDALRIPWPRTKHHPGGAPPVFLSRALKAAVREQCGTRRSRNFQRLDRCETGTLDQASRMFVRPGVGGPRRSRITSRALLR